MIRASGALKFAALIITFLLAVFLTFQLLEINMDFSLGNVIARSMPANEGSTKPVTYKCGLSKACPKGHLSFKMASGAASVVGPRMCLEDKILMSGVKNNVGRGINIALVNGRTGEVVKTAIFDMWAGDVAPFIKFLKEVEDGTLVMMASFDDPATKLNDEARKLITDLGSSMINSVGFRDNWIFVGGKGIKTKSPFEQVMSHQCELQVESREQFSPQKTVLNRLLFESLSFTLVNQIKWFESAAALTPWYEKIRDEHSYKEQRRHQQIRGMA